ncbi:sugar phosphate isomerase/epimerase [Bacillus sp. 03113]|uniref:sugar phosphate isomerase/epimerase family protein n=1 Tax=Bacillus sp. 03113 TaxID=2578211 RepID=UPI0011414F60|nr:sugar phosphate isomerase/epimerase [Bacillus sp. 03113]
MRLYASSTLLWGKTFEEMCQQVAKMGLQGIELWAEQAWHQHFSIDEIEKLIKQYGLKLSLHAASWDLNLCSLNKGIRRQSIHEIERSIAMASSLPALNVTIHPGKRTLTPAWTNWHMQCLQEAIDHLEEFAQLYGVTLSIELMESVNKEFVTIPDVMNELVENRTDTIMTTFDVAHIPIHADPLLYFKKLERINKIHLSDSRPDSYHVPLGEGQIQLIPILNEIVHHDLPIVLEGYDPNGQNQTLEKHVTYLRNCFLDEEKVMIR